MPNSPSRCGAAANGVTTADALTILAIGVVVSSTSLAGLSIAIDTLRRDASVAPVAPFAGPAISGGRF